MTQSPTTGRRFPAGVAHALLTAALAAGSTLPAPAQTSADPGSPYRSGITPAPVVRITRRPAAQVSPAPNAINPPAFPATTSALHRPRAAAANPQTAAVPGGTTPAQPLRQPSPQAHVPATPATPAHSFPKAAVAPRSQSTAAAPAVSTAGLAPAKPTKPAPDRPSNTGRGLNRNVVVLDPGHGGTDSGARIGDSTLEKNVTLALAFRLRSLLLARGFTVVLTRDSDAATMQTSPSAAPTPLTLDDRAGIADHAHAAACLLLHATGRGTGLHLYSSEIAPVPASPYLVPWLTAQAAWMPASKALESGLSAALGRSGIRLLASTASVRPLDSLTCPALVLELAPENGTVTSINDAGYQERVAAALAGALVVWENTVQPPPQLPAPTRPVHHTDDAQSGAQPTPAETQP